MIEPTGVESNLFNIQNKNIESLTDVSELKDKDGLKKASEGFESVFITKLLDIMDSTVERSGFLSGGKNEKMFKSLMNQEVAQNIASSPSSSFGLAKQIYEQMKDLV